MEPPSPPLPPPVQLHGAYERWVDLKVTLELTPSEGTDDSTDEELANILLDLWYQINFSTTSQVRVKEEIEGEDSVFDTSPSDGSELVFPETLVRNIIITENFADEQDDSDPSSDVNSESLAGNQEEEEEERSSSAIPSSPNSSKTSYNGTSDDVLRPRRTTAARAYLYSDALEEDDEYMELRDVTANSSDDETERHSCSVCLKTFVSKFSLRTHAQIHKTGKRSYKCDICEKELATRGGLKTHKQLRHSSERAYKCHTCDETFKKKFELNRHWKLKCGYPDVDVYSRTKQGHTLEDRTCSYCGKVFGLKWSRDSHVRHHHLGQGRCVCEVCGLEFESPVYLRNHKLRHHNDVTYDCDECGKSFRQERALRVHANTHMAVKPFPCEFCDVRFSDNRYLTNHLKTHVLASDVPTAAELLASGKHGTSLEALKARLGEFTVYNCEHCDEKFSTVSAYKSHSSRHVSVKTSHCDVCDKFFKTDYLLSAHKNKVHRPHAHPCPLCGKRFKIKDSVDKHIRDFHERSRVVTCDVCGRQLVNQSALNAHMRTHTMEKRFGCEHAQCGRMFSTKAGLERHVNTHLAEKPFQCSICNKKYFTINSLKAHSKSQHGNVITNDMTS